MNRHIFISAICCILAFFAGSCGKDNSDNTDNDSPTFTFTPRNGKFANTTLLWQEGRPDTEEAPSILVLYLHGGSSKGSDNQLQMKEKAVTEIKEYLERNKINAYFIVPQCPSTDSWGGTMNKPLEQLIASYNCSKAYGFGGSMGGTGIGSLASTYPSLFAGIMPVAWNTEKSDETQIAGIPIFTVMGTADEIMDLDKVSSFIENIISKGGSAVMEVEQGWTHEDTCEKSYTDKRLDWIFSH